MDEAPDWDMGVDMPLPVKVSGRTTGREVDGSVDGEGGVGMECGITFRGRWLSSWVSKSSVRT